MLLPTMLAPLVTTTTGAYHQTLPGRRLLRKMRPHITRAIAYYLKEVKPSPEICNIRFEQLPLSRSQSGHTEPVTLSSARGLELGYSPTLALASYSQTSI